MKSVKLSIASHRSTNLRRKNINLHLLSSSNKARLRRGTTCCFLFVALWLMVVRVEAQQRGFQPGASYALSDVEAIVRPVLEQIWRFHPDPNNVQNELWDLFHASQRRP